MKNNAPPSEIEELSQKVFLFQQMYENEKNQKEFFEQAYQKQMIKEIDQMNYHKKTKSKQIDYDINQMKVKLNTMPNEMALINENQYMPEESPEYYQYRSNSRNMQQNLNFYTDDQILDKHINNKSEKVRMRPLSKKKYVRHHNHTRQPSGMNTPLQQQQLIPPMSPFPNNRIEPNEKNSRNEKNLPMSRSLNTTGNQSTPYSNMVMQNQVLGTTGSFVGNSPSLNAQQSQQSGGNVSPNMAIHSSENQAYS